MGTIRIDNKHQVTVFIDRDVLTKIEILKEVIKVLTREVVKYEHGIDPDVAW